MSKGDSASLYELAVLNPSLELQFTSISEPIATLPFKLDIVRQRLHQKICSRITEIIARDVQMPDSALSI